MYYLINKKTGEKIYPEDASSVLGNEYEIVSYNIPTKEQFCKLMNSCRDAFLKEEKLNSALYDVDPGNALCLPTQQNVILSYLKEVFNDENEWVYYFACDLEYGRAWRPGMITDDGKDIPMKTVEELYDLLIQNLKSRDTY